MLSSGIIFGGGRELWHDVTGGGGGNEEPEFGEAGEFGYYKFNPQTDLDLRGKNIKLDDALDIAFSKTGASKSEFNVTKWAKNKYGKSMPVEWRTANGAEVNIDLGHPIQSKAPTEPHIGWQTAGKRGSQGAKRGTYS